MWRFEKLLVASLQICHISSGLWLVVSNVNQTNFSGQNRQLLNTLQNTTVWTELTEQSKKAKQKSGYVRLVWGLNIEESCAETFIFTASS